MKRCNWPNLSKSEIYTAYHDNEWGVPSYDDAHLFELFILESFHCGLSWLLILKKRENFRKAFDNFNPMKIANYGEDKINELLADDGIVRNRAKILATIANANAYLKVVEECGSFSDYLWEFTEHKVVYCPFDGVMTHNDLSDKIANDLKKRGFKFMGTVTCFSYLEAIGIMNNHATYCFKNKKKMLRMEMSESIKALDPEYSSRASSGILEYIKDIPECKSANIIFCYVGRENEINTMPIIQYFLDLGKQVAIPKCVGKGIMEAYLIQSQDDLELGSYGILEPKIESVKLILSDKIDLAIVPCLAANTQGYRLGYGGGFYDRYLSSTMAYRMVLCRETFICDDIPMEKHDQIMNMVVTEKRIIKIDEIDEKSERQ